MLRLCACRLDDMERMDVFAEDQMSILELDVSTDWIVYRQGEDQGHCFNNTRFRSTKTLNNTYVSW